jgi:Mn2+/Fe2+ NRAMP family transporter
MDQAWVKKLKRSFGMLGPGLITGASDDDPSGIATYSQAGAQFGLATLWTALITFPLMASIQEMCARIGLATSQGLTTVLKTHYPKWTLYVMVVFSCPAIVMNIGADIAGVGAVANLIFPKIDAAFFSVLFTMLLLVCIIIFPYRKIANTLKYLCVVLLVYLIVPFFTRTDWVSALVNTIVPHITFNAAYLNILVAVLGTTISPYLFFWQANMEVEELKDKKLLVSDRKMFLTARADTNAGMFFSNIVMFFIILTTGSVLAAGGVHNINTVEEAASALKPLAGDKAYYLFAFGVIGTGLLAIPVLSGSVSYIFSETFGIRTGLDKKFHDAKGFYIIIAISLIAGLSMNYLGISPMQALIWSAILYGLTAPVIIAIVLHICNNRAIMGRHTNGVRANILGALTLLLMTLAAVALLYFTFVSPTS